MEIKLKGRAIPRNPAGDVRFVRLGLEHVTDLQILDNKDLSTRDSIETVLEVFTEAEIVELVNRALYQLEYQLAAHRKYGMRKRAEEKALREALKAKGVDVKKTKIDSELKGE